MRLFKRRAQPVEAEHRTHTQIYLDGGGDPSDARTMAILAEADRRPDDGPVRPRPTPSQLVKTTYYSVPERVDPLHAHEVTAANAALIRMMAGATFGPDVTITLPSGRTITGAEMQLWLDANER